VLLVGHGSRCTAADAVATHAARLVQSGRYRRADVAYLRGDPSPTDVLAKMPAGDIVVVPMLMSNGSLARRLATDLRAAPHPGQRLHLCPPIGASPGMAGLVSRMAERASAAAGWAPAASRLLLIGHGNSRDPDSRRSMDSLVRSLHACGRFGRVDGAYLEAEPRAADALWLASPPTIVVGFLADRGVHAELDLRGAISAADRVDLIYAGPVGAEPHLADLLMREIDAAPRLAA